MNLRLFALGMACLSASAGWAQDEIKCNPEGSTFEMAQCARDDFEKADKALNKAYQALLKDLAAQDKETGDTNPEDSRVKRLKEAQRAWIDFRDKDCLLRSVGNFGGSIEQIEFPACQSTLTEERTAVLKGILEPQ